MIRGRRWWWTAFQLLLLLATCVWAGSAIKAQWGSLRAIAISTEIQWGWIALASAIILGTYALLIQSWRMLLSGWGSSLSFGAALRIWTIANLGRWIPGKVWSVGALGVLATREGVSGVAAAGAALLGTMLNIGAGFGIVAMGGTRVLAAFDGRLQTVSVIAALVFVVGTLLLPTILPPVLNRVAQWRGVPPLVHHLPARTLWLSTAINIGSWVLYGAAFACFAQGVTPQIVASPVLFVVVWTSSYLFGYLALFAPGGLVVREGVIVGSLVALGLGTNADATLLALASRLWLTVWEVLPGVLAMVWSARREPTPAARTTER